MHWRTNNIAPFPFFLSFSRLPAHGALRPRFLLHWHHPTVLLQAHHTGRWSEIIHFSSNFFFVRKRFSSIHPSIYPSTLDLSTSRPRSISTSAAQTSRKVWSSITSIARRTWSATPGDSDGVTAARRGAAPLRALPALHRTPLQRRSRQGPRPPEQTAEPAVAPLTLTEERFQPRSGSGSAARALQDILEQNALRSTQTEEQRRAMLHAFGLELARPPTKLSPTVTNNAIEFNSEL